MGLVVTLLAFAGIGVGCLTMAWRTWRRGGAQLDDTGGFSYFRGGGLRAAVSALAFASLGIGALLASVMLAREALG
jgi:hypothetical protein